MNSIKLLFLILFISASTLAQSVNLGVKLESLYYSYKITKTNYMEESIIPIPLSGYIKLSVLFNEKYEVELKGGVQLEESFVGPEYALIFKYQLFKNIFPLLVYLNHSNKGDSRTGNGTYSNNLQFVGIGAEARLTKVFGLDLTYYIPIGEKGLGYSLDFSSNSYRTITTSKIESLIKLGFIFNINL